MHTILEQTEVNELTLQSVILKMLFDSGRLRYSEYYLRSFEVAGPGDDSLGLPGTPIDTILGALPGSGEGGTAGGLWKKKRAKSKSAGVAESKLEDRPEKLNVQKVQQPAE